MGGTQPNISKAERVSLRRPERLPNQRFAFVALVGVVVAAGFLSIYPRGGGPGGPLGRSTPVFVASSDANLTVSVTWQATIRETDFPATLMCEVSGGAPPYTAWINTTGGGASFPWTDITPPDGFGNGWDLVPGNNTGTCTAIDSAGAKASADATIYIFASPSVVLQASAPSVVEGQNLTLTAVTEGGVSPLTFLWLNLPPGCPYGNVSSVTCTTTASGTWAVTVATMDAWGVSNYSTYTVTVTAAAGFLGIPAAQAPFVLVGLAALAAGAVAAVGIVLVRRRTKGPPPIAAVSSSIEHRLLPRETRPPAVRRAMWLGLLSALCAAFYLAFAWNFSYLTGFAPFGIGVLAVLVGVFVVAAAVRTLGFVLPLAGFAAGIALYYALAQPLSACTDSPAVATGLGVPTCGDFALTAIAATAVVGAIGAAAGVFLLLVSRLPRSEKPLVALGTVVALLIASCTFAVTTPPAGPYPSNLGSGSLPFPLRAGSAFLLPFPTHDAAANFTFWNFQPQAYVPVAADGYNPAILVGGWNATAAVCIAVQGFSYGGLGPVAEGFYIACGTSASFRVPLTPAVWQITFSIRDMTVEQAAVTITQTIHVVY